MGHHGLGHPPHARAPDRGLNIPHDVPRPWEVATIRSEDRGALILFAVGTAVSIAAMRSLALAHAFPFYDHEPSLKMLLSSSLYNGLAVAGAVPLLRHWRRTGEFGQRMTVLLTVLVVCAAMRGPLWGSWPDPAALVAESAFEAARALGVAFAVAYLAHRIYSRYIPTTLLRVRDITPLLHGAGGGIRQRRRHARNAMRLFDLSDREYIDTTRLHLRTRRDLTFSWREWADVTAWSVVLLASFTIYIEVYPRVALAFRAVLTSVMASHLLSVVPLLLLQAHPVDKLGASIPVDAGEYELAHGFRHVTNRWTKLSFVPIIVIAVLIRLLLWRNMPDLVDVLLLCGPTVGLVNLVYLECFRDLTVAEVHRAIPEWEGLERELWGPEPWRERSLMEGVEPLTTGDQVREG